MTLATSAMRLIVETGLACATLLLLSGTRDTAKAIPDSKSDPLLKSHSEYSWQREIAGDMPAGAWTQFAISARKLGEETGIKRGIQKNDKDYEDARRRQRDVGDPQHPVPRRPVSDKL